MSTSDNHDIVVYSSDRRPALVVEVRATKETSLDRASALRKTLLQRNPLLGEKFFLLAYSRSLFLWDKNASADAQPRTAAVKDVLRDYGGASADQEEGPSPESLMTMMYFWLDDLAVGIRKPKETSPGSAGMIVLAESNFVRELALRREEVDHAERILQLSERGQIRLAIPACAIPESFRVLTENSKRRSRLAEDMRRELHELARSAHYADLERTSAGFSQTLVTSADSERSGLKSAIYPLTSCATLIALDGSVIKGITGAQTDYNLQSGDASIFVSIDTWLRTQQEGEKIFVTKDQDFCGGLVSEYLAKFDCRFSAGSRIPAATSAAGSEEHFNKANL